MRTITFCAVVLALSGCSRTPAPPASPSADLAVATESAPAPIVADAVAVVPADGQNLDVNAKSLGASWLPNDPEKLWDGLSRLDNDNDKDKYETQKQYMDRIKSKHGASALYAEVAVARPIAVKPFKETQSLQYNPERQQFEFSISTVTLDHYSSFHGIEIARRTAAPGAYPALDHVYAEKFKKVSSSTLRRARLSPRLGDSNGSSTHPVGV